MGLLRKGVELLILGTAAGILIAGCGGGGNSTSSSHTPVASYIADGLGTGFTGWWYHSTITTFGASGITTASSVAVNTYTLNSTPTAGTYGQVYTLKGMTIASSVWASYPPLAAPVGFDLAPAGWAPVSSVNSLVDSGDGTHVSINNADGATTPYSISQTNLAGTTLTCMITIGSAVPCALPGNYPSGSSKYVMTQTANTYFTLGPAQTGPVTDSSGTVLTFLPTGATICDPVTMNVYQPASSVGTYNVYWAAPACTAAGIASAVAAAPTGTVQLTVMPTGNAVVPVVLAFSSWTGTVAPRNNWYSRFMLTLDAGNVYLGFITPAGTQTTVKNKTALNAELVADGLPPLP